MNNWHRIFNQKILERGEAYLHNGCVSEIDTICTNQYHATVQGSHKYNVYFEIDEHNQVIAFKCNCPFFQTGDNCKHAAAVLMYWEQNNQVLTTALPNHQDLKTLVEIRHEIAKVCYAFLGTNNYVACHEVCNFLYEMSKYLATYTQMFLRYHQLDQAFAVVNLIMRKFLDTPLDGDSEIEQFSEQILASWEQIYQQANPDFQQVMFAWFLKQLQVASPQVHYVESYRTLLETFWQAHFNAVEFYSAKLQLINRKIKFYQVHQQDSWLNECELAKWLTAKDELLQKTQKEA